MLSYVKLLWCSGIAYIYCALEEGVESICHGYMCIVLYMKLIWCNGFPADLCSIGGGGGVNLPWVDVHCAIYETYVV